MLKTFVVLNLLKFSLQEDNVLLDMLNRQDYVVELVLVLVILLLIANYVSGLKSNKEIVLSFFHYNFRLQLKQLPDYDVPIDEMIEDENIVEEDSPNFFRTYFTGRENLKYCILSLNTKRRQDFLVSLIYSIFWPEKDRILLEAAIPNDGVIKGLLYLVRINKVKNVVQEYEDLKMLCKKYQVNGVNQKKLAIFAEHSELLEFMFDKKAQEIINELGHLIETMEMSDCYQNQLSTGTTLKLIVSLNKCKPKDYQNVGRLYRLSLYKPSSKTLEKYKNNRTKFKKKQNQEQQNENNNNSKEERIKNMSNSEREKYLKKVQKRQKNRMQKKMKVKQM